MTMKLTAKSVALAAGTSFVISLAASSAVMADSNPFSMTKLSGESMQVAAKDGKCGEGKCGGSKAKSMDKKAEGKCGEGKCGGNKAKTEGKCGEGMKEKMEEGKCGGNKAMPEGKCGGK